MADTLVSRSPAEGLLPLAIGDVALNEVEGGTLTSLAPHRGRVDDLSDALKAAHGMAWPQPNRATGKEGARCLFFGRGQALLMGPAPDPTLGDHAALTDQSDAWTLVRLEGMGAEDVLARLVPIDLRAATFKRGHTARTLIGHMTGSVTRVGPQAFLLMVFRSMAATLVHEIETAARAVAARG